MAKKILIRADAGLNIGGGHAIRTSALGQALLQAEFDVVFATRPETLSTLPFLRNYGFRFIMLECTPQEEPDFLHNQVSGKIDAMVVDHYERGLLWETRCQAFAQVILALDDIPGREHDCDFLLDQTLGRTTQEYTAHVPDRCRVLAGTPYALLRPQFSQTRAETAKEPRRTLKRILIMAGASDPQGVTKWSLKAMKGLTAPICIDIVGGGLLPCQEAALASESEHKLKFYKDVTNIASLMKIADLAIGTAGSTSWERCCLGLPALLFIVADNQLDISLALEEKGVAKNLGWFGEISVEAFCKQLDELQAAPDWLTTASRKAYDICDGRGAERVVSILKEATRPEG